MIANKEKNRGFTLLGVLLILTVVVVISLYMAVELQQSARIKKIQYTAMQMQNILEAMLSYYVASGNKWPTQFSDLYNNNYLSQNVVCSRWPVGGDNHTCANNAAGFSSSLEGFTLQSNCSAGNACSISIYLPDSNTAKMVRAAIGYSTVTGNKVVAYIPPPKAQTQGNRVVQIGVTMDGEMYNGYDLKESGTRCGCGQTDDDRNCRGGDKPYHHIGNSDNTRNPFLCGLSEVSLPMPTSSSRTSQYSSCPQGTRPQIFIAPFGWNEDIEDGGGSAGFRKYQLECDDSGGGSHRDQNSDCQYSSSPPTGGQVTKVPWRILTKWTPFAGSPNRSGAIVFFTACISDSNWKGG